MILTSALSCSPKVITLLSLMSLVTRTAPASSELIATKSDAPLANLANSFSKFSSVP